MVFSGMGDGVLINGIHPCAVAAESAEARNRRKTRDLLRSRCVFWQATQQLAGDEFAEWFHSAMDVQMAIYALDDFFETTAVVAGKEQQHLWSKLRERVRATVGARSVIGERMVALLQEYGRLESRLHEGHLIDSREFHEIVEWKCADVAFARELICCHERHPGSGSLHRFWARFDECMEVIEDLDDIAEDGENWNFNFWLYPMMIGNEAGCAVESGMRLLVRCAAALESAWAELRLQERALVWKAYQHAVRRAKLLLLSERSVYDMLRMHSVVQLDELEQRMPA